MLTRLFSAAALAMTCAAAPGIAAAGTVELTFNQTTPFTDIGRSYHTQERALAALKAHFESLGKQLPADHKLAIEVTDIDLAGEEKWTRVATDLRVLRGRADWPRIDLRYTLSDGSRTLRQGSESIVDMAYLQTSLRSLAQSELAYERRMINRWFGEKIASAR